MKYFKILLGILGALSIIPLITLAIIIINKLAVIIFNIIFLKMVWNIVQVILMLFFIAVVMYGGYMFTTEFLEKHFKYFNKIK